MRGMAPCSSHGALLLGSDAPAFEWECAPEILENMEEKVGRTIQKDKRVRLSTSVYMECSVVESCTVSLSNKRAMHVVRVYKLRHNLMVDNTICKA
ncbi:hypothetical protein EV2_026488 [Malus domestica]